jgi:hypothetical protein
MNRLRLELSTVQAARSEVQNHLKALHAERHVAASSSAFSGGKLPLLRRELTIKSQELMGLRRAPFPGPTGRCAKV